MKWGYVQLRGNTDVDGYNEHGGGMEKHTQVWGTTIYTYVHERARNEESDK